MIEIELPDGRVLEFEGTEEAALSAARAFLKRESETSNPKEPEKPLAEELQGRGEAILNGVNQGVTLGWGDEIYGGLRALATAPYNAYKSLTTPDSVIEGVEGGPGFLERTRDSYIKGRDYARGDSDRTRAAYPNTQFAGELAGLLGTAGVSPIKAATTGMGKGLPYALRFPLESAAVGGATGAVYGGGIGEGTDESIDNAVRLGLLGAVAGGGLNAGKQVTMGLGNFGNKYLPEVVQKALHIPRGATRAAWRRGGGSQGLGVADRLPGATVNRLREEEQADQRRGRNKPR